VDRLALLEAETVAMGSALRAADPDAPVAACPGWTVRDLAGHVTAVHRWATAALDSEHSPPYEELPPVGPLGDVYAPAAGDLLTALRNRPAATPAWTFNNRDRTAGFWVRRQLHEIAVHRWDLGPYEIDSAVAEDGIDEVVEFMAPRQVALGRTTFPAGTLRLVAPSRTWTLGKGDPVTTVQATTNDLLLTLWGRHGPLPGPWGEALITP